MRFRKVLSVVLVAVMLFTVMSVGFTGMAVEVSNNSQYEILAGLLKNDYVKDLTNYTVTNTIPDDENGGFNGETRSFDYDHVVIAEDNAENAILKASNSFYLIAEDIMTYQYGYGCYDAATLVAAVSEKLLPKFSGAVKDESTGAVESEWQYYNVETILRYFAGNVLTINTANWFHSFAFVVITSANSVLEACNGIDEVPDTINTVIAVYEFTYTSVYNESMAKSYYAFAAPSAEKAWKNYGKAYGIESKKADAYLENQASAYLIDVKADTETKALLADIGEFFDGIIKLSETTVGERWDEKLSLTAQQKDKINADIKTLTASFSNEALAAVYGEKLGNMLVLGNKAKPTDEMPEREITGTDGGYTVDYVASEEKINGIIEKLDSLFSPDTAEEKKVSQQVNVIVKRLFEENIAGAENTADLEELMALIVDEYLISDNIINMLIQAIYPEFSVIGLVDPDIDLVTELDLALTPKALAEKLDGEKYAEAKAALMKADSWDSVIYTDVVWGVDGKESFVEAFAAAFSGIAPLVDCLAGNKDISMYDGIALLKAQNLYDSILVPMFSLMGVTAGAYTGIESLVLPLVSWFTDVLAKQPLGTVLIMIPAFAAELSKENNIFASAVAKAEIRIESADASISYGKTLAELLGAEYMSAFSSLDAFIREFVIITYYDQNTGKPLEVLFPALPTEELVALSADAAGNKAETLVLLARYVLTSFGYKANSYEPVITDCLGINLDEDFVGGKSVRDFVTGIMVRSDEVICAVAEFLSTSETGNFYEGEEYFYEITAIDYHESTLLNKVINPTYSYGTELKYSKYWTTEYADELADSFEPLLTDILVLFGVQGAENGLGYLLRAKLVESIFNNNTINSVFNLIYQFLADYNEQSGASISDMLFALFGVSYTPVDIADSLDEMMGYKTPASKALRMADSWDSLFNAEMGEDNTPVFTDVELDWGIYENKEKGMTIEDAFFRTLSALLTPFTFIVKNALLDENISVLGLTDIPGYAGYQYAFISLLETFLCPGVLSYEAYYNAAQESEANVFYNLFVPVKNLIERIYASPVATLKDIVPNVLFFASIGGFNDLINNLSHSLYVLADTLSPIVDVYDIIDDYLSDIKIGDTVLNISLPLDIDFDAVLEGFMDMLIGDSIEIEGVPIKTPVIDLYTLCVGSISYYRSKEGRITVRLDVGNGGVQLTCAIRTLSEILFYEENHEAIGQVVKKLVDNGKFDDYDAETITLIVDAIIGMVEDYHMIDMVLFVVHLLVTNFVPIADTVTDKFIASGLSIPILFESVNDTGAFINNIKLILGMGDTPLPDGSVDDGTAVSSIFAKIAAIFEKIWNMLRKLIPFI